MGAGIAQAQQTDIERLKFAAQRDRFNFSPSRPRNAIFGINAADLSGSKARSSVSIAPILATARDARTLGARRGCLIFRVAIPTALPNIFIRSLQ